MEGSAIGGVKRKLPFAIKQVPSDNLEPPRKKKFVPTSALKSGYDQRCTRSSSTKKVTFSCPDSPENSPKTSGRALKRCSFKPIRFPMTPTEGSAKEGTFHFGRNASSNEKKKLLQPIRLSKNDLLPTSSPFAPGLGGPKTRCSILPVKLCDIEDVLPKTSPFTLGRSQRRCTILPTKLCLIEDTKKNELSNNEGQLLSGERRRLPQPVRLIDIGNKTVTNVSTQQKKSLIPPIKITLNKPEANSKPGARKCLWTAEKEGKQPQIRKSLASEALKRRKTAVGESKVLKVQRRLSQKKQSNPEKINVGNQTTCDVGTQTDEISVNNESSPNGSLKMFEKMESLAATPKQIKEPLNVVIQNIIKRLDALEKVIFDKENRQKTTNLRKVALMNSTTKNEQQGTPLRVREGTIKTYRDVVSSFRFLETPSALISPKTRSTHKEHNLSRNILRQLNDL